VHFIASAPVLKALVTVVATVEDTANRLAMKARKYINESRFQNNSV